MKTSRFSVVAGVVLACLFVVDTARAQRIRLPQRVAELQVVTPVERDEDAGQTSASARSSVAPDRVATSAQPSIDLVFPADIGDVVSPPETLQYDPYAQSVPVNCGPRMRCGPRFGVFLDALVLRPGGADVTYAIEKTGCDPALSSPTGPTGMTSPTSDFGFRFGLVYFLNPDASIVGSYTWYENTSSNSLAAAPGTVLDLQVAHPSQATCGANSLSASASQDIRFQFLDVDFRRRACGSCDWSVFWIGGLRYGRLEQGLLAQQNTGVATGLTTVGSEITFDGFGLRLGLEGERINPNTGLLLYARGTANFLGGETDARYRQTNQFATVPIASNSEDYRIVSLLETELGIGWMSRSGRWRLTAGYQVNGWFNTLTTGDYIRGIRAGSTDLPGDTLTFDGLVARAEFRM